MDDDEDEPDDEVVACPRCGDSCERLGTGVWFCASCGQPWTPGELSEPPNEGGRYLRF